MSTSSISGSGVDAATGKDAGVDEVDVVAVEFASGLAFDVVLEVDEQAGPIITRQIKIVM
jgi:hypothetical protein